MAKKQNITYFIYILEASDGTYYTGLTKNLKKRLRLHNSGRGAKYLKGRLPAKLVYREKLKGFKSAMQRERQIKRLPRAKKEVLVRQLK